MTCSCIGTERPALKFLQRHVTCAANIVDKWYDIGMELLGMEMENELNVIKNNWPEDVDKCTEMFKSWLEKHPCDASWNWFIEVLKRPNIGLETLALDIEGMLSKGITHTYIYIIIYSLYLHACSSVYI